MPARFLFLKIFAPYLGRALTALFAFEARPSPLNCKKNEYFVLAIEEETVAQTVAGSIVWAFLGLKKPRSREISARSYALHSVGPQLSLLLLEWHDYSGFRIR